MTVDSSSPERMERALTSLSGLAVGDALGSQFFVPVNHPRLKNRELPPGPWQWTDDTEMACSVVAVLATHHRVDQDALARSFAEHHDFDRGYGPAVNRLLRLVREGGDWRELASALFNGQGSWGNGAAMRIAPLGAWYADDPEQATHQAEISAYPTHQHREAVVGAMAVAAAAALVAAEGGPPSPEALLDAVIALVPRSAVSAGLRRARDMLDYADPSTVAAVLGCGRRTSAHDTVPFALWSAARALGDYEEAFWATAQVGGDVDTNCAIVGGVLAAGKAGAPPSAWLDRTEALPEWVPSGA
ncbi:ADP-ribosylglycohydrolase family protein [Streptomyces sp. WI04-05B]|uniref:ADP-ribosylglycohydrolase family protein n=1 Tax=Streptomyces TaxID=1883 RepID=UPI0029A06490|nr:MULTISPECIES: ADP-ribosylglycohydrolase family protein [unclassified Streptomyces]MDX2544511.1 ADP-ribosylglycohydrolase family protein [Streptomyces sp. WI04-05B]MDX2587926.1 ADP-ribosylglycohydrolase family protein [Streptomyces sp. WI04-05A]MDX3751887.1 ADP-ribosylglycohydrolase family protein [Streptomyces sp. AK08-02]